MDLRKVHKIPQKYKYLVNGYVKEVQCLLPDDNSYFNLVDLIHHLILLYFYQALDSIILTNDEQGKFRNMLIQNNKSFIDNQWQLIYRMTQQPMNKETFFNKVYGRSDILLLIESECKNVFGGYTKTGWIKDFVGYGHSADKDAFVFQIRSAQGYEPFISNIKMNERADFNIKHALGYGFGSFAQFGNSWIFQMWFKEENGHTSCKTFHSNPDNYEQFQYSKQMLGGKDREQILEIEAFQMV